MTAALVLLVLSFFAAGAASDMSILSEPVLDRPVASYNEELHAFEFYNESVGRAPARRKALGLGESSPVTVTFYNSPGMDCSQGQGQCGYGNDVDGPALDANGNPFVETSLYPYHAASGNFGWLGGCGACGKLSYNGLEQYLVITDVTDALDELDHSGGLPQGSHIDLCLSSFQYFQPGTTGYSGGIFTGTWTRVPCSCVAESGQFVDFPDDSVVVRLQQYNQWAKAVVISRVRGVGEIASVNFQTRNGGFTSGARVNGWGAWWMPTADLGGQGGVQMLVTMTDGTTLNTNDYPLPDFATWNTGQLVNYFGNVPETSSYC